MKEVHSAVVPAEVQEIRGKKLVNFGVEEVVDQDGLTEYKYYQIEVNKKAGDAEIARRKMEAEAELLDMKAAKMVANYSKAEQDTFWIQEMEARTWKADNNAVTPFIDKLVEHRGIDKDIMVDKIIANSDALKEATAIMLGEYQKRRG